MKFKTLPLIALMFIAIAVSSQIVPPPVPPPPPPGLPIDGGLFFLLASGLIYGMRKKRK